MCSEGVGEVTGFLYGYKFLENFSSGSSFREGEHYIKLDMDTVEGLRNSQGVLLHNARANPGSAIKTWDDLAYPDKNKKLINIFKAFAHLKIDALISIGGDDTLKTANYLHRIQAVVLTAKESKTIAPTQDGIRDMVHELIVDHTIG